MLQDADNSVSERARSNAKVAPELEQKFYWLGYWNGRQDEQTFTDKLIQELQQTIKVKPN